MTITEFLLARIAEDEELPRVTIGGARRAGKTLALRQLAECEAKRAIVEYFRHAWPESPPHYVHRTLAAVYADHPDYDRSWA